MDIDYRLYLQELDRIEQDNQESDWAIMTEMISYEIEETETINENFSPLYDDEF